MSPTASISFGLRVNPLSVKLGRGFQIIGATHKRLCLRSAKRSLDFNKNGGSGYFEYNLNKTVGLVAGFGGYANTRKGIDDKLLTYMFGPRFNWRHSRLTPYVQFLFGGGYVWSGPTSTTQNAFATAAGGGVDYQLTDHIAIKPKWST